MQCFLPLPLLKTGWLLSNVCCVSHEQACPLSIIPRILESSHIRPEVLPCGWWISPELLGSMRYFRGKTLSNDKQLDLHRFTMTRPPIWNWQMSLACKSSFFGVQKMCKYIYVKDIFNDSNQVAGRNLLLVFDVQKLHLSSSMSSMQLAIPIPGITRQHEIDPRKFMAGSWNRPPWKRKIIYKASAIGFHVCFRGCMFCCQGILQFALHVASIGLSPVLEKWPTKIQQWPQARLGHTISCS